MSLITAIREDTTYKAFKRIFETTQSKVNIEDTTKEVLGLHASRTSRTLFGDKKYSPKNLLDANAIDLSARSRMAELRVKADVRIGTLREAVAAMRRHILSEYSSELKEYGGPVAQKSFADRVMKTPLAWLEEADAMLRTIDTLIKDLDQSGHSLHRMTEVLKLVVDGKGRTL